MNEMQIRGRKVIVQMLESDDADIADVRTRQFMTMDDEGGIQTHRNARQVVRWVKQRDQLAAKKKG